MQPSIADILALPVVQRGEPQIIGGGPLGCAVRWVHVSDLDDLSNLLQGGELVLTTGRALGDNAVSYLESLSSAGAAGLIVELGVHIDAIPPNVAGIADRLGLPVIALNRQIRFVDVTEEVHRSIVAEQYEEVAFSRHAHEVFTGLSMRRATLSDIVKATAEMLDSPTVLEDLNRQVLAFSNRRGPTSELLANWERRSRLNPNTENVTVDCHEHWTTTLVGPHRQEWGRLVIPCSVASPSRAKMALERAAQALALHRMVEQDRTALEQQAQSGLVDELSSGRIQDEADATARAHALGLRPGLSYLPITVLVSETQDSDQVLAQRRRGQMVDVVRHAIRASRGAALASDYRGGRINVLLSQLSYESTSVTIDSVCFEIRAMLERLDGVVQCAIGVGTECVRLLDAASGLTESAHIAQVALSRPTSDKVFYRAADTRLRGLVALLQTDPRVQAFVETELHGILEHRARHSDDTLDILRQFLRLGGNKSELAKKLHLSRPTLYSKLAMIQRLLGSDLEDAESRTSLHVALMILDSRNNERRNDA